VLPQPIREPPLRSRRWLPVHRKVRSRDGSDGFVGDRCPHERTSLRVRRSRIYRYGLVSPLRIVVISRLPYFPAGRGHADLRVRRGVPQPPTVPPIPTVRRTERDTEYPL